MSDSTGYTATYSLENRLASLTRAGVSTTYSYDAHGQRLRKASSTGSSTTVIFVYDPQGQLLGEYGPNGQAIREYVWLGSTPIAVFTPNGANPPNVYFIHVDHLNAPRLVVDQSNQTRWRWLAEPFGNTLPETDPNGLGSFAQNLRFPGQYFDSESGLHYNYFRDYDASVGRYVQSDPIGLAGGINTFSYAENNPLMYVDPQGLYVAGLIRIAVPAAIAAWWWMTQKAPTRWWPSMPDDDAEYCRKERIACARKCEEAQCDPDTPNVWGGSIDKCIRGCLPEKCGGNKT